MTATALRKRPQPFGPCHVYASLPLDRFDDRGRRPVQSAARILEVRNNGGDRSAVRVAASVDPCSASVFERQAHVQCDAVLARELHRLRGRLRAARVAHRDHFVEADVLQPTSVGHHTGVGGEDARDVAVHLVGIRAERTRQRHRCGVGPATSDERHVSGR